MCRHYGSLSSLTLSLSRSLSLSLTLTPTLSLTLTLSLSLILITKSSLFFFLFASDNLFEVSHSEPRVRLPPLPERQRLSVARSLTSTAKQPETHSLSVGSQKIGNPQFHFTSVQLKIVRSRAYGNSKATTTFSWPVLRAFFPCSIKGLLSLVVFGFKTTLSFTAVASCR